MKRLSLVIAIPLFVLGLSHPAQATAKHSKKGPVQGTWDCVAHGGQNGDVPFTLYLQQSGSDVTGSVSSSLGDADISTATFKKHTLRIEIDTDQGNYLITGKLAHGKLSGEWSHETEKGSWEGHRAKSQ